MESWMLQNCKILSIYHLTPDIFVLLIYSSASEYQMTRQSLNVYHLPDVHQSLLSRPTGSIPVSYKSKLSRLLLPRARCQPWLHCREISEIDLDMHPAKLDHNGSISTRLTKPDDSRLVMWLLIGSQQLWLVSETGATVWYNLYCPGDYFSFDCDK